MTLHYGSFIVTVLETLLSGSSTICDPISHYIGIDIMLDR